MNAVQQASNERWRLFERWLERQNSRGDIVGQFARDWINDGRPMLDTMGWAERTGHPYSTAGMAFDHACRQFNVVHPLGSSNENATADAARRAMAGRPPRFRANNARSVGPKMRTYVMARDNFRCRRCGASSCDEGVRLVIDHIVPVAKGGGNEPTNLQVLCGDCNAGKRDDAPHPHDLRAT